MNPCFSSLKAVFGYCCECPKCTLDDTNGSCQRLFVLGNGRMGFHLSCNSNIFQFCHYIHLSIKPHVNVLIKHAFVHKKNVYFDIINHNDGIQIPKNMRLKCTLTDIIVQVYFYLSASKTFLSKSKVTEDLPPLINQSTLSPNYYQKANNPLLTFRFKA